MILTYSLLFMEMMIINSENFNKVLECFEEVLKRWIPALENDESLRGHELGPIMRDDIPGYFKELDLMDDETKILIEYMKQSPNRQKVLKSFQGDVLRPSKIAILTGIHISSVSKCLRQLREKKLIYLLNPDFHIGRLYDITEKGKFIVGFLGEK